MKINPTLVLTSLFLLMMMGAGSVSAMLGYKLGYQSLKGVSQPDVNPTRKLRDPNRSEGTNKGLILVDEKKLLVKNYDYIEAQKKKKKSEQNVEKKETISVKQSEKKPQNSSEKQDSEGEKKKEQNLSLKSESNSVILETIKVSQEDDSLLISVNLKNNGNKAVGFVYSFLEIKDNKGTILSAIADGLPSELPANGNKYSGIVKIPSSLLQESEKLSLNLTDYPEQKIKLKIDNIPVLK
jgi:hypothetical protein